MPDRDSVVTELRAVLAEVEIAHDRAVATVNSARTLNDMLAAANELAAQTRKLSEVDAELRTHIVGRVWDTERLSLAALADRVGVSKSRAEQLIRSVKKNREATEEPHVPEPATRPEPQPVVAAIVTSHLGALAGQRNDGKPPWTFIAGEIEPGESQADAIVREVKEETGLQVRAGNHEIGRRVHPKTGRTMIYLACTPVEGTDVFVGDPDELADVQWLNLRQLDELMPGMFEPVREHLGRLID